MLYKLILKNAMLRRCAIDDGDQLLLASAIAMLFMICVTVYCMLNA